ncbi:hypothetical protein ACIPYS_38535 [Kitasatospora sp. NPDC089913]|uniref:hypothetical protein n=1 Tax=Kitasatospora sp. NPDC089913 TaxID=3364080 RepID=UPI0038011997
MAPWESLLVLTVQFLALGLLALGVALIASGIHDGGSKLTAAVGGLVLVYPVLDIVVLVTSWPMNSSVAVRLLTVGGVLVASYVLRALLVPRLFSAGVILGAVLWLIYLFASGGLHGSTAPNPTSATFPSSSTPAAPPGTASSSALPGPAPTATVEVTVTAGPTASAPTHSPPPSDVPSLTGAPIPTVTVAGPTIFLPGPTVTVTGPTLTAAAAKPSPNEQSASSDIKGWVTAVAGLITALLTGGAAMYTAVRIAPRRGRHGPGGSD